VKRAVLERKEVRCEKGCSYQIANAVETSICGGMRRGEFKNMFNSQLYYTSFRYILHVNFNILSPK